jgi:hypothetical protein
MKTCGYGPYVAPGTGFADRSGLEVGDDLFQGTVVFH